MDERAARRRDPIRWLPIGGAALMVATALACWAWLPEPMAVKWSWDGPPNNSMSRWLWLAIDIGAWLLVTSALIPLRAPLDWRRLLLICVAGITLAAHVGTLENNLGAGSWTGAEPLDRTAALLLALASTASVWLIERSLDRST